MSKTEVYPYCEHNRMGDACEDCAYARAKDEGLPLFGPPPAETREANARRAAEAADPLVTSGASTEPAAPAARATRRK